jgi:CarboxypepD_reg-like domain
MVPAKDSTRTPTGKIVATDSISIYGMAADSRNNEPIAYVEIYTALKDGKKMAVYTDVYGVYRLKIPAVEFGKTITLQASFIGYHTQKVKLKRKRLSMPLNFALVADITKLH